MRRLAHKALIAFLAAWIPFCCCQARAAINIVAARMEAPAQHCCCKHASRAGHCATSVPGKTTPAHPENGCCECSKDRVLPTVSQLPAPDTFGAVNLAIAPLPHMVVLPAAAGLWPHAARCTGPPGIRSGRELLRQSNLLLV